MSKKGRQRRTPEKRYADKDRRSTVAYALRMMREVAEDTAKLPVSETGK
jgi:hypothetical protein